MNILLLGAGGLLGRYLAREFAGHDLTAVSRCEGDITSGGHLDELFATRRDAVINAAAVCDFDACETDPEGTGRVNLDAPLELARRCAAQGALFVQYSSDYVFAGDGEGLYTEDDAPRPLSVYGRQKAGLEKLVPDLCPRSLLLRVSWVYGLGGRTFMSRLPDLLSAPGVLRTAAGKRGCCLYAADGAFWTRRLVEAGHTGLFNLVNAGETSWEEFARATLEQMKAQSPAPACSGIEEVPYTQLGPGWTKRPRRSGLDPGRLAGVFPPGPRPWREALAAYLAEWKSVAGPQTL